MIWELYQYYTTPTTQVAKKMAFLEEAISMAARRKRCLSQWDAHFKHCQEAILEAVAQSQLRRKIIILGAGSLLDIPVQTLAEQFEAVYLVDIVFLKAARQQVKLFKNVYLVEQDVTGVLEPLLKGESYQSLMKKPCHVSLEEGLWQDRSEIDCIVSLNLLSQLPLIPVNWLLKKTTIIEKEAERFGQKLIQDHLTFLNAFEQTKCLISDRNHIEFNQYHQVVDEFNPLWEVEVPPATQQWDWEVIPLGEGSQTLGQKNTVGVSIWKT